MSVFKRSKSIARANLYDYSTKEGREDTVAFLMDSISATLTTPSALRMHVRSSFPIPDSTNKAREHTPEPKMKGDNNEYDFISH